MTYLVSGARRHDHITPVLTKLHWFPVCKRVMFNTVVLLWKCLNDTAPGQLSELCCDPVASASQVTDVNLCRLTPSSQNLNHDQIAELRCRGTISVEQSFCCSMKTRNDSAHFQETTEGLSVPHLMCWQTEGTFTTARCCCGIFAILAPDTKPQTYLLTYLQAICSILCILQPNIEALYASSA